MCDSAQPLLYKQVLLKQLRSTSLSEETATTLTQTPRSDAAEAPHEPSSAPDSPRSCDEPPKSTDLEGLSHLVEDAGPATSGPFTSTGSENEDDNYDDEEDEEDDEEPENSGDYYDFLRELAGSYDMNDEDQDDKSEDGSEDETSDEEDDNSDSVKSFSAGSAGLSGSEERRGETPKVDGIERSPSACGEDISLDSEDTSVPSGNETGSEKEDFDSPWSCSSRRSRQSSRLATTQSEQEVEDDYDCRTLPVYEEAAPSASTRPTPQPLREEPETGGASSRQGSKQLVRVVGKPEPPTTEAKRCQKPSPSTDRRLPVKDGYDVMKAVQHYAMQNPRDWVRHQRQIMLGAIDMKKEQAQHLDGPATHRHVNSRHAVHYARVRAELLREVQTLEDRLATFDKACEARREQIARARSEMAEQRSHAQAVAVQ